MCFEVEKVANGYIVRPGYSWIRNGQSKPEEVYVFPTVAAVSGWLAEKFGEKANNVTVITEADVMDAVREGNGSGRNQ